MEKTVIDISWASLWRILLIVFFALAIFLLRDVFVILFLALVISSAIDTPISFLERRGIPRILGALFIFFMILAVLSVLLYIIVPVAAVEFNNLSVNIKELEIPALGSLVTPEMLQNFEQSLNQFTDVLLAGGTSFVGIIPKIFGGITFVVAVFVLSFYLSASKYGVERFLRAILPPVQEDYVIRIYLRAKQKLGLWLQGQLILSLIVGFTIFIGLMILGVKYGLIFGILGGILEMVPFVGPVITGVLAFFVAVSESWTLAISVIVLFLVLQQLENHLLVPFVMRRTVGLHPVVVVISLLAGAKIAGFAGLLLAVPTAVVIQEIIEDWAARKNDGRLSFSNDSNDSEA
ncbi:MAG: AI-2E family transporter [Patescibacteria group bacterium]